MLNFKEFPFKKKLVVITLFISFIVLFISSTSFFSVQYTTTESSKTEHIESITTIIARNITAALVFKDKDAVKEILSSLQHSHTIQQALVLDQTGSIFSMLRADGPKLDIEEILGSEQAANKIDSLLVVKKPVVLEDRDIGTVIIADNLRDIEHQLFTYVIVAVVVLIASLLIALILSAELHEIITDPISQLSEIAEKVTNQQNYSIRAHKTSNDEIGVLIDNFNEMIAKMGVQNRQMTELNMQLENRVKERTAELEEEIHTRKQTESYLKLSQFSVDLTSDCIYWVNSEAKIIYVNTASCTALGYAKEELLEMSIFDIDPLYPKENWKDVWQLLKEQSMIKVESIQRRKDGTTFPVEVHANYVEFEGREYDFAFVRDISDRKTAEDVLRDRNNNPAEVNA